MNDSNKNSFVIQYAFVLALLTAYSLKIYNISWPTKGSRVESYAYM